MDDKSVRYIRTLAARSGEVVGPVTVKNVAAKSADKSSMCTVCGGTGWRSVDTAKERRVIRCECFIRNRSNALLHAANIPIRYSTCDFASYDCGSSIALGKAKITVQKWAEQYPINKTGILLIGPSGVGKTHLAVAALKCLLSKGVQALFCDYRDLLKRIQDSYNPSVQATELEVLKPVFKTDVIVLDDLGAVKPSEWVWDTVSVILNMRYNENRTTIITSNFDDGPAKNPELPSAKAAGRKDTLGDRIGERMRSRLFEMCHLLEIDGKDYRERFRSAGFR